jgi:hypothetical protein
MRDLLVGYDLVLAALVVPDMPLAVTSPAEIVVVMRNAGSLPVQDFWVELYVDPVRVPQVNDQWSGLCAPAWPNANCYGGAWHVTQELAPGETMTLTSQSLIGDAAYSHWPGSFVQEGEHKLFVLVDSYSVNGNPQGALIEENEGNNGTSMTVTVASGMMVALEAAPVDEPGKLQER